MVLNTQQFRLIEDPIFASASQQEPSASRPGQTEPEYSYLSVPVDSLTCLELDKAGRPVLRTNGSRAKERLCYLETVYHGDQLELVFLCPADLRQGAPGLKLNGQPAPTVALLGMGDQIQVGSQVLHVTIFNQPAIGPATGDQVGRECAFCRVPFESGTVIYHCPCGAVLHCESTAAKAGADPLKCVENVSVCPTCQDSIHLQEGYLYAPCT